ncbi:MAG TPA: sugar ABC transporter substrate-binding protein, partial [Virgibacillus sp.]|nr:sugar ABC transporter substrate-binding protein [Virgibacillus sp.]
MKQQKGLLWLISIFILSMILAGCSGDASGNSDGSGDGDKKVVGIAMPTKSSERWVEDGNNMVEQLEDLGYETDLQYAEDVVE